MPDYKAWFEDHLEKYKSGAEGFGAALCPAHDDKSPSLQCNERTGWTVCRAGCGWEGGITKLAALIGAAPPELPEHVKKKTKPKKKLYVSQWEKDNIGEFISEHPYKDAVGNTVYWVRKYRCKNTGENTYRPIRYEASGKRRFNMGKLPKLLYNLDLVASSDGPIWWVEGEKDADNGRKLGLVTTTNMNGAGHLKFDFGCLKWIEGKSVNVIPDNDEVGENHAQEIAKLLHKHCDKVKVFLVRLPLEKKKSDLSDWIAAGGTLDQLLEFEAEELCGDPKQTVRYHIPKAPVSENVCIPRGYEVQQDGMRYFTVKGEPRTLAPAPIVISGRLKDVADGAELCRLSWLRENRWQHETVSRETVANGNKIVTLSGKGLPVTSTTGKPLVNYLAAFEAENLRRLPCASISRQMGWQGDKGELGFLWGRNLLRPDGTVGRHDLQRTDPTKWKRGWVTFHGADSGEEQLADGFKAHGDLEGWLEGAKVASRYPKVALGIYASLAAPMLSILGAPNFCIDWSALTSTGKTTTLRLAASVWGDTNEKSPSCVMSSWDNTRVWVERASTVLDGLPLILDDTKRAKRPEEVASVIYQVANGRGRGRGSPNGMRRSGSWSTVLLSSGENPATSFTEDGGTVGRTLTIWGPPLEAANVETGRVVSDLTLRILDNYGHAGPRFLAYVQKNCQMWESWIQVFRAYKADFNERAGENSVAARLGTNFATLKLTAMLAHEALDLDWDYNEILETIWAGVVKETTIADRPTQALEYVMNWAVSNQASFWGRHEYQSVDVPKRPPGGWAGKWDYDRKKAPWGDIAFTTNKLDELLRLAGHEPSSIKRIWADRGWLESNKANRYTGRRRIDGSPARCVAILRSALTGLGFDNSESDDQGQLEMIVDELGVDFEEVLNV